MKDGEEASLDEVEGATGRVQGQGLVGWTALILGSSHGGGKGIADEDGSDVMIRGVKGSGRVYRCCYDGRYRGWR